MNERLRLVLCGACVAIGAFHAPLSTHVLAEDLAGTYGFVVRAEHGVPPEARVAATRGQKQAEELGVQRGHHDDTRVAPTRR